MLVVGMMPRSILAVKRILDIFPLIHTQAIQFHIILTVGVSSFPRILILISSSAVPSFRRYE